MPYGGVHQGVRGPGVEGQRRGAGGDDGDVGDPAEVQGRRHAGQRRQGEGVGHGHQRCSLATGGDVPAAQVGDDGQSRRLGDPGGLAELEGAAHGAVLDPVVQGLPVRDHQVGAAPAQLAHGPHGHVGERLPDAGVQLGDGAGRHRRRRQAAGDQVAQPVGAGGGKMAERTHLQGLAPQFEIRGGRLDGVVGRA
ncbi:hypothetical protein ADK87_00060 [Streptomyces sp. NRRL F-4711]|nr:hypothetical protein ADK87_00060 [Streptomyces sp. NRRL F-4711]